ncbi:MAG TPA: TonB-dependent receptor [Steroidobacteraceae bacterium]|nr:TonB-dependent receptor [Steroidobacteraceae bacterium]
MKRCAPLCSLLLVTGIACADPTYHFDIRSASLDAALKEFAAQSGLQVAYFTQVAAGRTATPVSGTYTAEQALRTLLNASGLTFERIDAQTLAIRRAERTTSAVSGGQWDQVASSSGAAGHRLRLAQLDTQAEGSTRSDQPASIAERDVISEVVVTGTHIRGVENDTVPILSFDRQYIERSGYSNMMQFIESLPLQFKGGPAGATESAPFGGAANMGQNLSRGTGFNLHGLGSVSTLTLINGRRVAPSGQGQFVDVSTIPLAAVERIEILTDGASAIYGADAVAGVVNILLRKDFDGAETGLQYGAATQGGTEEQRVSQLVGQSWSSGNALLVAELYKRDPLDAGDRDFLVDAGAISPTYLLPKRKMGSLVFNLDQQLPAGFDVSSNVLYSYEEVLSMDTDDGEFLSFQSPTTNKWSASLGLGYMPTRDWRISLDGTLARVETKTAFEVEEVATGEQLAIIRDYHDRYHTWTLDLKGDGPLFELPGGAVRLALGASYRADDVNSTRTRVIPVTRFEVRAIDSREVTSFFGELYVPIVGERQDLPWAKRIELSLAGRYDDYSDFGDTTNPRFGLVWSPIASLDLRASISSSFRAPTVAEKALSSRGQQISTEEVFAPDGVSFVPIFTLLGSGELTAEEADSKAVGFTFRPQSTPGLELSINYFDIDYTNRIGTPPFDLDVLSRRDEFGTLITDIASDAAAQAYLDALIAQDWLYIDFVGSGAESVRYVVDGRQKNAARSQISGFDVSLAYGFTAGADSFRFDLNATHLRELLTSLSRTSKSFEQIDTYNQPLDWRGRILGSWQRGGMNTSLAVNYSDSYINNSFGDDRPVEAWTTVDFNLGYDFGRRGQASFLDGSKVSLSVSNLFDQDPPKAPTPFFFDIGFDVFNADALGRFVTLRYTKQW